MAQKRILFSAYRAVIFVGCLLLMVPDSLFRLPATGLDPSWEIAINLAVRNHLRFGQDFVFTFGPLGVLATRLPIGMSRWSLAAFDAAVIGLAGVALFYVLRRSKTYFAATLVLLTVLLLDTIPQHTFALTNVLFLLFLFALFFHLQRGDLVSLIVASAISWLLFYLKANLGLASVPIMIAFCAYLIARPRRISRVQMAVFLAIYTAAGLALAVPLNVDLPGYVRGSLHLAESYSDAMAAPFKKGPAGDQYGYLALTIVLALGLSFVADRKQYRRDLDGVVRLLLTSAFVFLVFKHSFVRAWGHYGYFFHSVPAAIGLLTVFAAPAVRGRLQRVFLLTLIFSFPLAAGLYNLDHLSTKLRHARNYAFNLTRGSADLSANPELEKQRLPQSTLDLIQNGSVDVMPWEISTVYANDLAYAPRPVVQSYTTYDGYLDKLNEAKYFSPSAPEYVIFSPGDIDNRHPLFVEPRTRRALLTHYDVAEETQDYLLFKRRDHAVPTVETITDPQVQRLGESIDLGDAEGLQYVSAGIEYSLLGKLARFFYQPPFLKVRVEFEDGQQQDFRAIKTLVNDEVLVSPFFDTVAGAGEFFRSSGDQGRRVRRIQFYVDKPWAFEPEFTYRIKTIQLQPQGQQP